MHTQHALWPGAELGGTKRPDVQGSNCMRDCATETSVASHLPDHARNAHGNLAEQNRLVGAQRGADTGRPASAPTSTQAQTSTPAPAPAPARSAAPAAPAAAAALAQQLGCMACHAIDKRVVGPAFKDVAKKYDGRADAVGYLSARTKSGGSGVWGSIPMPPQSISEADAKTIARWLAAGAPK